MGLRNSLFKIYWALRRTIAPSVKYAQHGYEEFLTPHVTADTRWIDIGCGHAILPSWRSNEEERLAANCKGLVGLDYDLDSLKAHRTIKLRVRGDVGKLPFRDGSFDLVTANMVVEHLTTPQEQFHEISRILKPKGLFLFHTPNASGYGVVIGRLVPEWLKGKLIYLLQGRREHDVFQTYYRANSEKKIVELARASGFQVVKVELFVSDAIFAMVPPIAVVELVWLRLLMTGPLRRFRTNILTVLQKSGD